MNNNAIYQNDSATRHNLFRLGLIRVVVIIGQGMALAYFSWIKPIDLQASSISIVLAIYASVTIATANRGRLNIPINDREFFAHLIPQI